jgi:hypothetical protein
MRCMISVLPPQPRVITVGDGEIRAENTVSGESGSAFDLTIDGLGTKRTSISVSWSAHDQ